MLKNIQYRDGECVQTSNLLIFHSIEIAQHAIRKAKTLGLNGTNGSSDELRKAAYAVIEPLTRIASAFPFMILDIVDAFRELKQNFKQDTQLEAHIDENLKKIYTK